MSTSHTAPSHGGTHRPERFSTRCFIAFGLIGSFMATLVSGVALFVAPMGRIARQIDWQILAVDRAGWEAIHIAASLLFMALCLWHFVQHTRVIRTLFAGSPTHPGGHPREIGLAAAVVLILVVAALAGWPPASWLTELNQLFRQVVWLPG